METDIMICRSNSPEDRRLSKGLLQRSVLFQEKGIKIFDMATMAAGLHMVHEATEAALSSHIIILLASIDFLTDPLMEWLTPLILLRHQQDDGEVFILPILLRDCLYSHSSFARIPLANNEPMRLQSPGAQERMWEDVCKQIFTILGIPNAPAEIETDQYLHKVYQDLLSHPNLKVRLLDIIGSGTFNHGLGLDAQPHQILFATKHGQQRITCKALYSGSMTVHASGGLPYEALIIAKKNDISQ